MSHPRVEALPDAREAASRGVVVLDRPDRVRLAVRGRAPQQMLTGILSGTMSPDLEEVELGVRRARAHAHTVLTPKGKLVTDLLLHRLENGPEGGFLLDLPAVGLEPLLDHFTRYLPPRMAKAEPCTEAIGHLTLVGPDAAHLLSREALGLRVEAETLEAMAEGEGRVLDDGTPVGIRVTRGGEAVPPSFEIHAEAGVITPLRDRLLAGGAVEGSDALRTLLRMERGRPEFGVEIDRDTLPPEAGLDPRAIDHGKGCYTGQEVIVRIRDRGRVNRKLRGLLLGEGPLPEVGEEIWVEGRDRSAGEVRSVAYSLHFGQGIALAMVRREAEPPTQVHLGGPDGPAVEVRALRDEGWDVVEGDLPEAAG